MLTPQNTYPAPNAVYAPMINIGMTFDSAGNPQGVIRNIALAAAYVDDAGAWHPTGTQKVLSNITFGFDPNTGLPTGLPADLVSLAPQIAAAWQAIVMVIADVNAIRKLV